MPSNTDIHFAVGSADQNGNVVTTNFEGHILGVSADHTFHTLNLDAVGLPTILEGPTVDFTNEIATVIWKTDVSASSQLRIGVPENSAMASVEGTPVFGQPSELVIENNNLTTHHALVATGLLGNQAYLYRAASTNDAGTVQSALPKLQPPGGDGGFTTSTEADTQFPVITSPPNVVASTATSLTIEWDTDEISSSSLTFGTSEDSLSNRDDDGTNVTTHRRVLSKLAPGTTYAYQAGSTDASGNGITLSKVAFGTTPSDIDLTAPVITSDAEIIYKTDLSATLSWGTNEASNAQVSYGTSQDDLIQVRSDPEFNTDHSMTLTNLSSSTTYYFQVSSADQSNNGPVLSAVDSFTTDAVADIINPEITGGSIDSSATDNTATIIWKTNELSDSAVKYGTSGGSLDFTAGSATDVTDHSVTLTNLTASTQYFFLVESTDRSGNGPAESTMFSFTTLDSGQVQVALPPTNLQTQEGNSTVLLTWEASASAGVTGYTVERAAGESDEFASIATLDVLTSYVDATAQNGTAYRYQIRALGAKQTAGDPSETTAAVTPDAGKGPAAPTLSAIQGDPLTPTLVIKNSSGAKAYSFHISGSSLFGVGNLPPGTTSCGRQDAQAAGFVDQPSSILCQRCCPTRCLLLRILS